ncbi:3-methyladenine DNA glycosylase AlkC [Mycobacterium frederiksbergense]|uniref:3-methyladenine DNA glycosylase AlkC n=1 Tax=Mycolicibacterium frederiksbergense TaxID=117567 RepID=A0ABT6L4A4_9MYCO|nr:DNA alkylation repair protein [Mycolicibacterium frederiksbergense]MDH6197446.1 3-methyladenine DNA glycosylase AlkC [Mycolicibacterium frederiksbergense]
MKDRGTSRRADITPEHLTAMNEGRAASRTLAEALAVDHTLLLRSVLPDAEDELRATVVEAQSRGILGRMQLIGAALERSLDTDQLARLAAHPSDTVRGWSCFAAAAEDTEPARLLTRLRPFADNSHFAVREWAWMAARPILVTNLDSSIALLAKWTKDKSERTRRFASEALRPRGVWATHIAEFKADPDRGLPILNPLRVDPSRYVQDSVANWINDAAKTNPDWARILCRTWRTDSPTEATERITRRALRSL